MRGTLARTPEAIAASTAASTASAASPWLSEYRSIIAPHRICAAGLASPLPAGNKREARRGVLAHL